MGFDLKGTFNFLKREGVTGGEKRSVGIDIGASTIKVVEIRETNGVLTLSTYGELQLGPYLDQPTGATVKLDQEQSTKALVDVIRESGVTAKRGVFSVPLASSFLTTIAITAKDTEEVVKMIPVEARKYIPIPLNEVALDWYEIENQNQAKDSPTRDVLLAAIQNESLSSFQRLLNSIGMMSQPTEIEVFSAIRATVTEEQSSTLIIDLGASMSKLYLTKGYTLQKLHRVKTGGEQLTKRLSELRSCSFEEAEHLKRNEAANPEYARDIKTALVATMERPLQEFQRVIQLYTRQYGVTFDKVQLIGGGAQLDHISEYVSETLMLPVVVANPFARVAYPAFMEDVLDELGSSFSVALGAALRVHLEN
jgi:type IV pilus assembly protein PilM